MKGKRSGVILATKVGVWKVGTDVNKVGLSRKSIMDGLEDSRHWLGTDYIDLYYAHKPDPVTRVAFDNVSISRREITPNAISNRIIKLKPINNLCAVTFLLFSASHFLFLLLTAH